MSLLRSLTAGVALAAAVTLFIAAPAAAHDELVESDPAAGHNFTTAPESISLRFSGDVMTVGALVVVADQSGKDWADGQPEILAGKVIVPLQAGLPDAGYEVRWRVVSEDGHPISGLIPFTVGGAAPLERDAAPSATPEATTAPAVTSPGAASAEPPVALQTVLMAGGGAVVALAIWVGLRYIIRRTRGSSASSQTPTTTNRKTKS